MPSRAATYGAQRVHAELRDEVSGGSGRADARLMRR